MNTAMALGKINPLNQVLITHVLNEARLGNYNHCRALGFTDEMLVRLQNLTPSALTLLTHAQVLWIKPQVDHALFNRLLTHIDQEEHNLRLIHRALSLGASNPLMQQFFALNHHETALLRRALPIVCKGRTQSLSEAEKQTVWRRWMELVRTAKKARNLQHGENTAHQVRKAPRKNYGQSLDNRQQLDFMMLIAEEQSLSLASIWNEISGWLSSEKPQGKQARIQCAA